MMQWIDKGMKKIVLKLFFLLAGLFLFSSCASEPVIRVVTKFPEEPVTRSAVDVAYKTSVGMGNKVSEVYYSINGEEKICVYALTNGDVPKIGKLGKCRVQLFPGENNIVFTVKDSLGQMGECIVQERLVFKLWRGMPPRDDSKLKPLGENEWFIENRIIISVEIDTPYDVIARIANDVGGAIIGHRSIAVYYIEVADNTESELTAICELLMSKYKKDGVRLAYLDYAFKADLE